MMNFSYIYSSIIIIGLICSYTFQLEYAGLDLFNVFITFGISYIILLTIYYLVKLIIIIIKFLFQVLIAYYRYKMEELELVYDVKTYDNNETSEIDIVESVSNITYIINILNKDILFANLYKFILEYKLRHLPIYTNKQDLSTIPYILTNGKKMEDIDRYIYSVLLTITTKAKENENLSFEYFLECLEIEVNNDLFNIEKEYFQFICFHDKLNEFNCFVYEYSDTKPLPYLKNNRFYKNLQLNFIKN